MFGSQRSAGTTAQSRSRSVGRSRGGADSLASKIRLQICQQTTGLGAGGPLPPVAAGAALEAYTSRLSPAGDEYLRRIGEALAEKQGLAARDITDAAKALAKFVIGEAAGGPQHTTGSKGVSNNLSQKPPRARVATVGSDVGAPSNAKPSANSRSQPQPAPSTGANSSSHHHHHKQITANHSTDALLSATTGMVQQALKLQQRSVGHYAPHLSPMLPTDAHQLPHTHNTSSIGGGGGGYGAAEDGGRRRKAASVRGTSSSAYGAGAAKAHSNSTSPSRRGGKAPPTAARSSSSMACLGGGAQPTHPLDNSHTYNLNNSYGHSNLSTNSLAGAPPPTDAVERAMAIGQLRPHMVRRIRALNADAAATEAISADLTRLRAEEAQAAADRAARRANTQQQMRRQEEERAMAEEAKRSERAAAQAEAAAEAEAIRLAERQKAARRRAEAEAAKAFLNSQRSLRADTRAKEAAEARAEEATFRAMYAAEDARIAKEQREHKQMLREDISEYLAECTALVEAREAQRAEEAKAQREAERAALALQEAKEAQRFGLDGIPSTRRVSQNWRPPRNSRTSSDGGISSQQYPPLKEGAAAPSTTNTTSTSPANTTSIRTTRDILHSPQFLLATRDRDRTDATRRKMAALREAQDMAAEHYAATMAAKGAEEMAAEARIAEGVRQREREKEERHTRERVEFLRNRARLVDGLDEETALHRGKAAAKLREKLEDRAVVDAEARRVVALQAAEERRREAEKQQFIAAIDAQRVARFEQILQPLSVKIGNEGDHDYSKSSFAPKRETIR